jgi:hypothetical protein
LRVTALLRAYDRRGTPAILVAQREVKVTKLVARLVPSTLTHVAAADREALAAVLAAHLGTPVAAEDTATLDR